MKKKTPCTWVWKKVAKGGDWFVWWSLVCFAPRPLLCKPLDLFAQERIPSLLVGKLVEQQRGKSSVSQISGWGWFWPRPARETTHSMHRFLASLSSLPQQSNNNCSTEESSDHHFQNLKFISCFSVQDIEHWINPKCTVGSVVNRERYLRRWSQPIAWFVGLLPSLAPV